MELAAELGSVVRLDDIDFERELLSDVVEESGTAAGTEIHFYDGVGGYGCQ